MGVDHTSVGVADDLGGSWSVGGDRTSLGADHDQESNGGEEDDVGKLEGWHRGEQVGGLGHVHDDEAVQIDDDRWVCVLL